MNSHLLSLLLVTALGSRPKQGQCFRIRRDAKPAGREGREGRSGGAKRREHTPPRAPRVLNASSSSSTQHCQYIANLGESAALDWSNPDNIWPLKGQVANEIKFTTHHDKTGAQCVQLCEAVGCSAFMTYEAGQEAPRYLSPYRFMQSDQDEGMSYRDAKKKVTEEDNYFTIPWVVDKATCYIFTDGLTTYWQANAFNQVLLPYKKIADKDKYVLWTRRNCNCAFRYMSVAPDTMGSTMAFFTHAAVKTELSIAGEGIYEFVPREKTGFSESIYRKLESEEWINPKNDKKSSGWAIIYMAYVPPKNDIPRRAGFRVWLHAHEAQLRSAMRNPLYAPNEVGELVRAFPYVPNRWDPVGTYRATGPDPSAIDYLDKNEVGGTRVDRIPAQGNLAMERDLTVGHRTIIRCARTKEEAEGFQKEWREQYRSCTVSWFQIAGPLIRLLGTKTKSELRGNELLKGDENRVNTVVEAVIQMAFLVDQISSIAVKGDAAARRDAEMKRTACAQVLITIVKNLYGIGPKLAQNLAMRPDIISDDFVREALKETQTENIEKSPEEVIAYLKAKGAKLFDTDVTEVFKLEKTLGTGSVGQVLLASRNKAFADRLPEPKYVVKVAFDENLASYAVDLKIMEVLYSMVQSESGVAAKFSSSIVRTIQALTSLRESILDEFNLFKEADWTEDGMKAVQRFSAENGPELLGLQMRVPIAIKTSSQFCLIQGAVSGSTLKSVLGTTKGYALGLIDWRFRMYYSILKLYGWLVLREGFFQGDPHPGNWLWDYDTKTLWLIDWGAVGDIRQGTFRMELAAAFRMLAWHKQAIRAAEGVNVAVGVKGVDGDYIKDGDIYLKATDWAVRRLTRVQLKQQGSKWLHREINLADIGQANKTIANFAELSLPAAAAVSPQAGAFDFFGREIPFESIRRLRAADWYGRVAQLLGFGASSKTAMSLIQRRKALAPITGVLSTDLRRFNDLIVADNSSEKPTFEIPPNMIMVLRVCQCFGGMLKEVLESNVDQHGDVIDALISVATDDTLLLWSDAVTVDDKIIQRWADDLGQLIV